MFVITTDSTVDMGIDYMIANNIPFAQLFYSTNGVEKPDDMLAATSSALFDQMRQNSVFTTSQPGIHQYTQMWESSLKEGKDILHLSFSSAISSSFNSAQVAASQMSDVYPERKIIVVDTLSASSGQGLLLRYTIKFAKTCTDVEECADFVENLKLRVNHWFTVGDLVYLKRGGRVSTTAAFFGTLLAVKPIMQANRKGQLVAVDKVNGRKASLKALVAKMKKLVDSDESLNEYIHIVHSDCMDDALFVKKLVLEEFPFVKEVCILPMGAVIGSHCGPGTLGLFFVGAERTE